ncbi:MAG: cytochrome c biogenesis protein, partial [Cytophagales bacterium]|nr:cytochrome c biogenesis protein [Cytophagales bacterium]
MAKNWWKALAVLLLTYSILAGLLMEVPKLAILNETIRNLFFHVPMWFGMITLLLLSCISSIRYLSKMDSKLDKSAVEWANVGILYGVLGILTGMLWAKFTWGDYWTNDPKLNGSAIGLLIYLAY